MAGTLKDIVREGAAPPEAFGFSRGGGRAPSVSPPRTAIGGRGSNSTPELDGPIQKTRRNSQA